MTAYGRRVARADAGLISLPVRVTGAPLRLDAPLVPEAGGGPVLDPDGRLVGIATASGAPIAWADVQRSYSGTNQYP